MWADKAQSRLTIVFQGCFVQGCTSLLTVFFLAALLSLGPDASTSGPAALGHLSGGALLLFACISACGVAESLAAGAVSVAVEKDWVPAVFEVTTTASATEKKKAAAAGDAETGAVTDATAQDDDNNELTSVNAAMSRIDLCAEFLGPVLAGLCLSFFGPLQPLRGFACIGFFNAFSFAPQYILLRGLHSACPRLRLPKGASSTSSSSTDGAPAAPNLNETSALVPPDQAALPAGFLGWCRATLCDWRSSSSALKAWPVWLKHPGGVPLVSLAYALLYFTALSPHGIPLTAFLASRGGVDPLMLAIFRGAGAAGGILGLSTFELVKNSAGLRTASVAHLGFQTVCVLVAASVFDAGNTELFMVGVVASRIGLYGFDVGFMELQQRNVEEKDRNAVGAVDNALTSIATFGVYACSLHVSSASAWSSLTWASAVSVCFALGVFGVYLLFWRESSHAHSHDHNDHHHNGDTASTLKSVHHQHTSQQARALSPDGTHAHVYYVGPSLCDSHAHDHDHVRL